MTHQFKTLLAALALCCAGALAASNKLGLKATMRQSGLTYMKNTLLPVAEKKVLASSIPDMKEREKIKVVGKVDVELRNMKINRFHVTQSSLTATAPGYVTVSFAGLDMDATLNWHYRKVHWPHIRDSGRGEAKTTKTQGSVRVRLGTDSAGRPTATIDQCAMKMSDLSIKLHGGASWLYNLFIKMFHGKIVNALDRAVCNVVTGDVQKMLAKIMATIPVQQNVGKSLAIDYHLVGINATASHDIVLGSPAEFYPQGGSSGGAPDAPVTLPDVVGDSQFQVIMSAFSARSIAYAAMKANLLKRDMTKDKAPAAAAAFFTTDFYGMYAPGMITKFGAGKEVSMHLEVHNTPAVQFNPTSGITVRGSVELTVRARNAAGAFEDAFTIALDTTCAATAKIKDLLIIGEITDAKAKASVVQSQIGNINVDGFNELVVFALSIGQEMANELLAPGTPLPTAQGIRFVNPKITYGNMYLAVTTNIEFTPPASL